MDSLKLLDADFLVHCFFFPLSDVMWATTRKAAQVLPES